MAAATIGDYVIQSEIGSGVYGVVYKAKHKTTGKIVAIKSVSQHKLINSKLVQSLESEIKILQECRHPNIVALYEIVKTPGKTHMVMELCEGGEFSGYMKKKKRLSEPLARHFLQQLAAALHFMHTNNLVHRDLKPTNLLMSKDADDAVLKVADFGYARYIDVMDVAETSCGTPLYMAPEVFNGEKYDGKVDLWSVGCILYEMLVGQVPYTAQRQIELFKKINESNGPVFPSNIPLSDDCKDLIRGLLRKNPFERISFGEFLWHPFVQFADYQQRVDLSSVAPLPRSRSMKGLNEEDQPFAPSDDNLSFSPPRSDAQSIRQRARSFNTSLSPVSSSPSMSKPRTKPFREPDPIPTEQRGADDADFVVVEKDVIQNLATAEVLTTLPTQTASTGEAGTTQAAGVPEALVGSPPSARTPTPSPSSGSLWPMTTAAAVLSKALAVTGMMSSTRDSTALGILNQFSLQQSGTPSQDEKVLFDEIDNAARGALAVMDYADLKVAESPKDAYLLYQKALSVFTFSFRRARRYWEQYQQTSSRPLQALVKFLQEHYETCLEKAEKLQVELRATALTTSTVLRDTNRTNELLVDRARSLGHEGAVEEVTSSSHSGRSYKTAILLLEIVLQDEQNLSEEQKTFVHHLSNEIKKRLNLLQRKFSITSSSPPNDASRSGSQTPSL